MFTNIAQTSRFGRSSVFTSAEAPWLYSSIVSPHSSFIELPPRNLSLERKFLHITRRLPFNLSRRVPSFTSVLAYPLEPKVNLSSGSQNGAVFQRTSAINLNKSSTSAFQPPIVQLHLTFRSLRSNFRKSLPRECIWF
ncbi:MAG: hypothetical protein ACTS41_01385 [Candidatus Hodgkinia cicadicola]